ncbi:MAG: hypothetical protein ISR96_02405 [Nitrospira sp.]|nr:hypothetical protein [bacterium]MBL7048367.1 hypothetical protein [Nitrospira sp.]
MTIEELKKLTEDEFQSIDKVLGELQVVYVGEERTYTLSEKAAVSTFIINIYSGMETVLKQMLVFDKLDVQDSPEWHEKILRKSAEIGILPPELHQMLVKCLAFRQYFMYSYVFNIKWDEVKVMTGAVVVMVESFKSECRDYLQSF